jgi:hypothetical protein
MADELTPEMQLVMRAAVGMTFTLREAEILDANHTGIRPWLQRSAFLRDMLECAFCTSFWTGMLAYVLWRPRDFRWRRVPLIGFAAATYGYEYDLRLRQLEEAVEGAPILDHAREAP